MYGVYQPHVYASKFTAFSHYADVAEALALPQDARLVDLKVAAEYVCSLSRTQLNSIFEHMIDDTRNHLCFHATFIYTLLTFGFGFDPYSRQIEFKGRFGNGEPVDYIHGAMIYELNQDPSLVKLDAHERHAEAAGLAAVPSEEEEQRRHGRAVEEDGTSSTAAAEEAEALAQERLARPQQQAPTPAGFLMLRE